MDAIDHTLRSFTPVVYQSYTGSWEVAKIRSIDDLITGLVDKDLTIATLSANTEHEHQTAPTTATDDTPRYRSVPSDSDYMCYAKEYLLDKLSNNPIIIYYVTNLLCDEVGLEEATKILSDAIQQPPPKFIYEEHHDLPSLEECKRQLLAAVSQARQDKSNDCISRSTALEKAWQLYDEMDATSRDSHTPKVLESVVDGYAVKPTIRNDFSSIDWYYSIRDAERDDIPPACAIHRCSRHGCVICDSRREFVSTHTLHHYHHIEGPQ